jgi:hypothetical protein
MSTNVKLLSRRDAFTSLQDSLRSQTLPVSVDGSLEALHSDFFTHLNNVTCIQI